MIRERRRIEGGGGEGGGGGGALPGGTTVLVHPVFLGDGDLFSFGIGGAFGRHGDAGGAGMVDAAGAVPGHILVLVVGLARAGEAIVGVGELPLDVTVGAGGGDVVVVDDTSAAHDDAGAEFTKDGAGGDDADGPTFVRVRNDLTIDEISLGVVVDDDLEEFLMFLEEEVAVAESDTAGGFGGEHVETGAPAGDGEGSAAISTLALQMTPSIDLGLAVGVQGQDDLVIDDFQRTSFFVDGEVCDMGGTASWFGPTTTRTGAGGRSTSTSSSRRGRLGDLSGRVVVRMIPIRRGVLRRPTEPSLAPYGRSSPRRRRRRRGRRGRLGLAGRRRWRVDHGCGARILVRDDDGDGGGGGRCAHAHADILLVNDGAGLGRGHPGLYVHGCLSAHIRIMMTIVVTFEMGSASFHDAHLGRPRGRRLGVRPRVVIGEPCLLDLVPIVGTKMLWPIR